MDSTDCFALTIWVDTLSNTHAQTINRRDAPLKRERILFEATPTCF